MIHLRLFLILIGMSVCFYTTAVSGQQANRAPIADAGRDQDVGDEEVVTLDGSGSTDPEGEALTYSWRTTGNSRDITLDHPHPTSATASFTTRQRLSDVRLTFWLVVTDASGNKSSEALGGRNSVIITIRAGPNDPAIANAGPDQTVEEGALVRLDASASRDPEGVRLTYFWSYPESYPDAEARIPLSSRTSATPSFTAPTQLPEDLELSFTVQVDDNRNVPVNDRVVITVKASPNAPPIANAGPDQTVDEETLVTLAGTATDPDGDPLTYAWTGPTDVPLTEPNTATPTFTAPVELVANRDLEFTLVVTDARNLASEPATVTITVTAGVNDAPIANAGPAQTVNEGDLVSLDGAGSSDPEGEALTFEWIAPDDVTLTGALTAAPSFTAPVDLVNNRDLEFTLVVTDARNLASEPATVTITVTAGPNDPPIANAGPDRTVAEGEVVTLDGTASSDPEGVELSYTWFFSRAVPVDDINSAITTFTAPTQLLEERELDFGFRVSDGVNNAVFDRVSIFVTPGPNDPPIANAGPDRTVEEGTNVELDGRDSFDPEGEVITYAWTVPDGVTLLTGTDSATPRFIAPTGLLANRELVFRLVVTDASSKVSAADTVTITVTPPNDPPIANAGPDRTVDEGALVMLDATGSSDPEGKALGYYWYFPEGVTLDNRTSGTPSFTAPTQLLEDTKLEFNVSVNDGAGRTGVFDRVSIFVTAGPNDPPIVNAGPNQTVDEGELVTLVGTASDPEGEALTFEWFGPDDVTLTSTNTATTSFTAPEQLLTDWVRFFTLRKGWW